MEAGSPDLSKQMPELPGHRRDRSSRGPDGCDSGLAHRDQPAWLAAALRPRLAEVGVDQALLFQPLQRRVDAGRPDRPPRPLLDVAGNGDCIGFVGSEML